MKTSATHEPNTTSHVSAGRRAPEPPDQAVPRTGGPIGRVVGCSLAIGLVVGLVAALLLAATTSASADVDAVTGAVLCGFALGWALLAGLSERFTDQPQRWALAPAAFMATGGVLLVTLGSSVRPVLDWVWPPGLLVLVVWMVARARRQLRSRPARWLVYPVFAVLTLVSVGGGYETASRTTDAEDLLMAGEIIDVGGHGLHISCTGSGSPTVVLEAGGGETSASFGWIAPDVSRTTRVCVYDRAGHGWSEAADHPQDGAQVAADLHTLLGRAQVPGPYVMVGHSFGGLYVLAFADRYPADVAGMVLVDSTPPRAAADPSTSSDIGNAHEGVGRVSALLAITARLGLPRVIALSDSDTLPQRSVEEIRATTASEAHARGTIEEYLTASVSGEQAAQLSDFADKPLRVLTAGNGSDAAWIAAHERLADLSTNGEQRTISGATHSSLIHDEHDARTTARAIIDVVSVLR